MKFDTRSPVTNTAGSAVRAAATWSGTLVCVVKVSTGLPTTIGGSSGSGMTVMLTCATFDVIAPSKTLKVKKSWPLKFRFGVYVTWAAYGPRGVMAPSEPLAGGVTIENVRTSPC